jgi:hypothetical protein
MPEPEFVRVYDGELNRTYTAVRSSVVENDKVSILKDEPALDDTGTILPPDFDVKSKPKSGPAANQKEN